MGLVGFGGVRVCYSNCSGAQTNASPQCCIQPGPSHPPHTHAQNIPEHVRTTQVSPRSPQRTYKNPLHLPGTTRPTGPAGTSFGSGTGTITSIATGTSFRRTCIFTGTRTSPVSPRSLRDLQETPGTTQNPFRTPTTLQTPLEPPENSPRHHWHHCCHQVPLVAVPAPVLVPVTLLCLGDLWGPSW